MAFTIVTQGTFTQPATAVNQVIPLPSGCDYFKTYNYTKAIANAPTGAFMGEWFGGGITAANDGIRWGKNGSTAVIIDNFQNASSNPSAGFTYVTSNPAPQAACRCSAGCDHRACPCATGWLYQFWSQTA